MKKRLALFIMVLLVMLVSSPVFASVGTVVDGVNRAVTDIKFKGTEAGSSVTNTEGVLTFNLLLAGGGNNGGTSMTSLDTTVDVSYNFHKKKINTTETVYGLGTLPDGRPGQILAIYITEATTGSWTLSPTTSTHFDSLAFNAAGDSVILWWVDDTNGWAVVNQNSVTVTLNSGL